VLLHPGFVPIVYRGNESGAREAGRRWSESISLPGGFRLLIGHDLGDRARIGAVMVRALALSLIFFAALAALGALFVARRVLQRIDDMNTSAHGIMAGDLTRRLPVSGSGDELDRLAEGLNEMLGRIAELMEGLREVSDNIAHDCARRSRACATTPRRRSPSAATPRPIAWRSRRRSRSRTRSSRSSTRCS
jgi:methyl-accepting chemotaxis protein